MSKSVLLGGILMSFGKQMRLRREALGLSRAELADLTRHYYERGYYRNEKYTL